jgi:hypothetical protein
MRRRPTVLLRLLLACLLVGCFALGYAVTTSLSVPASNASANDVSVTPGGLEPGACTGTVTAVVTVPASGSLTLATGGNLILGTSGNDNVTAASGYNCFVGGGPVSSNKDKFNGPFGGGDECIVATSDTAGGNIKNCAVVQRSP